MVLQSAAIWVKKGCHRFPCVKWYIILRTECPGSFGRYERLCHRCAIPDQLKVVYKSPCQVNLITGRYQNINSSQCIETSWWFLDDHLVDGRHRSDISTNSFTIRVWGVEFVGMELQSNLDISKSDISNSAKLEASIWIKNTFWLLSPTLIWRWIVLQVQITRSAN